MPQAIPGEDAEAVKELVREFTKRGIRLYVSSRVTGIEDAPGNGGGAKKVVHVESPEGHIDIAAEKVLVAVGRAPYIGELGLDRLGLTGSFRRVYDEPRALHVVIAIWVEVTSVPSASFQVWSY